MTVQNAVRNVKTIFLLVSLGYHYLPFFVVVVFLLFFVVVWRFGQVGLCHSLAHIYTLPAASDELPHLVVILALLGCADVVLLDVVGAGTAVNQPLRVLHTSALQIDFDKRDISVAPDILQAIPPVYAQTPPMYNTG